jgi:hypothetical protein
VVSDEGIDMGIGLNSNCGVALSRELQLYSRRHAPEKSGYGLKCIFSQFQVHRHSFSTLLDVFWWLSNVRRAMYGRFSGYVRPKHKMPTVSKYSHCISHSSYGGNSLYAYRALSTRTVSQFLPTEETVSTSYWSTEYTEQLAKHCLPVVFV